MQDNIKVLTSSQYNYTASQIIIGVGLSSSSVLNVERKDVANCAYWGWGCGSMGGGPYSTDGLHSKTWDQIAANVEAGKGFRGHSGAEQGFAWWYFFPSPGNGSVGELTWWNNLGDFDYFADFVLQHGLGGVFSWIATSDARDWRIHRRLAARLGAS